MMTAIVSLAAIFHRPALLDISVGVPFSAAVAAITLALGVVAFVAPPQNPSGAATSHRAWAFLLPTGLLTLLIGFGGAISLASALILVVEGAAILLVCAGPGTLAAIPLDLAQNEPSTIPNIARTARKFAGAQLLFAFLLAIAAGWGLVQGAGGLALHNPAFRPGVAAALALGPAIVLPMIPPLATLAEHGRRDEAISTIVGFALINLCVALPLAVVVQQLTHGITTTTQPSAPAGLPFPILVWRLDTVLLSTIGLLLLPTAIGRWALSRTEGLGLVGVYVIYLFLTLVISHG
jgi:Ca2+/Na+ antiporter